MPDLSDRTTVVMAVPGSETPGLSAAMAGSFHLVMSWFMIFASVSGVSWRESTPLRLKATAMGETYTGISTRLSTPPQRFWASVSSWSASGTSLPPKAVPPEMNWVRPAPEPTGS